jgi:hypothetical protein
MVLALHTVSGQIADVSPKMMQHPHFKNYLIPVEDGRKPYAPKMYKGGTVEEKTEMGSPLVEDVDEVEVEMEMTHIEEED